MVICSFFACQINSSGKGRKSSIMTEQSSASVYLTLLIFHLVLPTSLLLNILETANNNQA